MVQLLFFFSKLGDPLLAISTSRVFFMSAAFSKLGELSWSWYQAFRYGVQKSSNSCRTLWKKTVCYWMPLKLFLRARKVFLQAPWIVTQKSGVLWNIFQSLTSLPPSPQRHPLSPCSGRCQGNTVLAVTYKTVTCTCSAPLANVLQGRSRGRRSPTCSRQKGIPEHDVPSLLIPPGSCKGSSFSIQGVGIQRNHSTSCSE